MKNYKEIWAKKAQEKAITRENMVERCILKAMSAKSEDKEHIVECLLKRAFTPLKNITPPANYRSASQAAAFVNYSFRWNKDKLFASEVLETADEWDMFNALLTVGLKKEIYNGKD